MDQHDHNDGTKFLQKFYLTELIANVLGAPIAATYGGCMVDFSTVQPSGFIFRVILVMLVNQLCLALPLNLALGRRLAGKLDIWASGKSSLSERRKLFKEMGRINILQSGLIVLRIFLCSAAVLILLRDQFSSLSHMVASFSFGAYAGIITGVIIFFFLQGSVAKINERLVVELLQEGETDLFQYRNKKAGYSFFASLLPSLVTGFGVLFLCLAAVLGGEAVDTRLFIVRICVTVLLNVLIITVIFVLNQLYQKKRVSQIISGLGEMAEHGDLTYRLSTDAGDSLSWLALHVNRSLDVFSGLVQKMGKASEGLSVVATDFDGQVSKNMVAIDHQANGVQEVVTTMGKAVDLSTQVDDKAAKLVNHSRDSLELVDSGFGKVQDMIGKMEEIKDANKETNTEIHEFFDQISSISEIIEIINNIANQTKIIAFNAELEAAAAGEKGDSFRIVAEEIRRLANNTVESLWGIKTKITEIQGSSEKLIHASVTGTGRIGEGMDLSSDLNDIFVKVRMTSESTALLAGEIASLISEQNQGTRDVMTSLRTIEEGSELVRSANNETVMGIERIKILVKELNEVAGSFTTVEEKRA